MTRLRLILAAGDFVLALCAQYCGMVLSAASFAVLRDYPAAGLIHALFFACALVSASSVAKLYGKGHYKVSKGVLARVIASTGLALVIFAVLYLLAPHIMVAKGAAALSLLIFGLLQFFWHNYHLKLPGFSQNLLILGTGALARQLDQTLAGSNHDYLPVGFVRLPDENSVVDASRILGPVSDFAGIALQQKVHKVVVAIAEQRGVLPVTELLRCRFNGVEVVDAMSFYEEMTGKVMVGNVNPAWFIYSSGFEIDLFALYSKRALDIVFSLLGIALFWPLMLLVAAAVKLDSPGPVLFRQMRVGKNDNVFELYKFRTMREDAESESGAIWAATDDPRITRLGTFLRKCRLDEMPQFFNVLLGDMAFVGPRPERPEFVLELYQLLPYYSKRHALKPGVTGWAQVNYPYGASVEDALEKLNYDLYYIKNYSIFLDILIVMETVEVVLSGRGGR